MPRAHAVSATLPCPPGRVRTPWRGVLPPAPREPAGTEHLLEWSLGAGHVAAIVGAVVGGAWLLAWLG